MRTIKIIPIVVVLLGVQLNLAFSSQENIIQQQYQLVSVLCDYTDDEESK